MNQFWTFIVPFVILKTTQIIYEYLLSTFLKTSVGEYRTQ